MFPAISEYSLGLVFQHQSPCWISVFSCLVYGQQHGARTTEMQLNWFLIHAHTWGFCCDFCIFLMWSNDEWKADKSKTPGRAAVEEGGQKVLRCLKKSSMTLMVAVGRGFYLQWCWDMELCSCWPGLWQPCLWRWFWRLSYGWKLVTCGCPCLGHLWCTLDILGVFQYICVLLNKYHLWDLLKTH